MKIDVAYGSSLDDSMLNQLMFMEADAYACYENINNAPANRHEIIVGIIPTETLKHFKRRMSKTLFLMKTKKSRGKTMLVAMACVSKMSKKCLCFHTLYVKYAYRRKGIGSALLKKAMGYAKANRMSIVLSVNPLNTDAIRLYKNLGFRPQKDQSVHMEWQS